MEAELSFLVRVELRLAGCLRERLAKVAEVERTT